MKFPLTFLAFVFLSYNLASAQEQQPSPTICQVSKSCKKACDEKAQDGHDDNNSAYQQLLLKCAEDVAKNLQLIK